MLLKVSNIVKHYNDGDGQLVRAIDGVSLSIEEGDFVALYGPSGSGKSTLLDLIAGLRRPDSGTVLVEGRDISTFSEGQRANYLLRTVGLVGQSDGLLPSALARENAALKLWRIDPRGARRRVEPLLTDLGLGERLNYSTRRLSVGERQRVAIALALSTEPKLLLADEPTGNLDTARGNQILQLLQEQSRARNMAILLATHDPQAARYASHTYELIDGHLKTYQHVDG